MSLFSDFFGEGKKRPQYPPIPPPQNSELKFEYAGQIYFVPFQISYVLNPGYRDVDTNCDYPNASPFDAGIFTGLGLMVLGVGGVWLIAHVAVKLGHHKQP